MRTKVSRWQSRQTNESYDERDTEEAIRIKAETRQPGRQRGEEKRQQVEDEDKKRVMFLCDTG